MSIEAMKLALDALTFTSQQSSAVEELVDDAIAALTQAIAEAEKQEPVGVVDSTISGHIEWLCMVFPKQGTKLYTHPQPKQWVGLTDEEIQEIALEVPMDAIRITEAKLKEKNT